MCEREKHRSFLMLNHVLKEIPLCLMQIADELCPEYSVCFGSARRQLARRKAVHGRKWLWPVLTVENPVVTICTTSLTFNSSTFCPHGVFMCFVWIWEQTAIISPYSINWLVCITETECVYCAVRTGSLYIILRSVHTVYLCVLCGSENKQPLFPYTALTDWFV